MNKVFDNYSKYYDLLYQDKDYIGEADYIASLINKFAPNTKNVLELGCGTGKHAKLLSEKHNFDMFGIDLSETMLEQAKLLGINCQKGDVRTFQIDRKFDSVVSLFHVASYQNTNEDILDFFKTASNHLNPNGIFIFDVWYKPAVLSQLPEKRTKKMENSEIKVIRDCTPKHVAQKSMVEVYYDIEIIDKPTQKAEKISEKHLMRYFSKEEIFEFAKLNKIEIIHSEEWLTGNKASGNTWGVCFIGVKK